MSESTSDLQSLLAADTLDLDAIGAALDAMDEGARVQAVRSMGKKTQVKLWAAAEGRGASISDIVPEGVAPGKEVIHAGKNSLPLFSHFEKRFCRVNGDASILYGYNEGSTRPLIGPGYFVTRFYDDRQEAGVDYYAVPPDRDSLPSEWPNIKPNESGLQMFVFAKMVDYLRKVSSTVTIGRAVRKGKETNNYFLLCRTGD